jgi:16S rRNA (guanine966-N2)-methyltransferase
VRPTTERAREALFAALGAAVLDARVLDLYAGSGALALEALSRGAARAVLVEADPVAAEVCRRNAAALDAADRARVRRASAARFVTRHPPAEAPFDLVFVDPPYDLVAAEVPGVLAALLEPGWLAPSARVVVESPASAPPPVPAGYAVRSTRRYGDTLLTTVGPVPGA